MSGLQTAHAVEVLVDFDRVVLVIGANTPIAIPYATSFKVAQGIRVAAKTITRLYGVKEKWPALAGEMASRDWIEGSRKPQRPRAWAVRFEGEDVAMKFDDFEFTTHFSDALRIGEWIRSAGRQCKRNVGDTSRHLNAAGSLSDAEENYKIGR